MQSSALDSVFAETKNVASTLKEETGKIFSKVKNFVKSKMN